MEDNERNWKFCPTSREGIINMNKMRLAGIRFIVTSICNYNCTYCHNEWEPKERSLIETKGKLVQSFVAAAKELGGSEVDITGGEPLLEIKKVKTILTSAKKYGMWTNMTTNGFYLTKNAKNLKKWGLNEIHIHIPSLNPERYRSLMRGNSNLDEVLSAIEVAKINFEKVMINCPIEKSINDDEIPNFIEYFGKRGVIPRFIEATPTKGYMPLDKEAIESLVKKKLGNIKKTGSYLWGINTYVTQKQNFKFETLRCICFDKKCDICPQTNFIHIDKDYQVRPCNLRPYRINPKKTAKKTLIDAVNFLRKQTDIPEEYKKIWG